MVALVRTEWSGTSGGPGLTQLAVLGAAGGIWNPGGTQGAVDSVRAFWDSLKGLLPNELSLQVSPVIDDYDTNTGELVGSFVAATTPTQVLGTSATNYAAGAGFKVTWNTGSIRDGRRVRGSTFVVPAASGVYDTSGLITSAAKTTVNTAAAALILALDTADTSLAVWSRPRELPTVRTGLAYDVETGSCSSKTAILRGRRD